MDRRSYCVYFLYFTVMNLYIQSVFHGLSVLPRQFEYIDIHLEHKARFCFVLDYHVFKVLDNFITVKRVHWTLHVLNIIEK